MKVFRKGSEVKDRLRGLRESIGDIKIYAQKLAEQAQKKHFHQVFVSVEYVEGTFRTVSQYVIIQSGTQAQLHTLLDTVLDRVEDAAEVVAFADEWLPLMHDDDWIELDHADLIKLKLDPLLPG